MGNSWTCGLCETEKRWPTKGQALEHIRENHLETLLRASLERADEEPTVGLPEYGAPEEDPLRSL